MPSSLRLLLSFGATLVVLGAALAALHYLILWLRLSDLAALLLFAVPLTGYLGFSTQETAPRRARSALIYYISFAAVVLSAAGLVYVIG